ncbi:hypothetical protein [Nakamurella sp.]|uniref:Rv3212 family protein n=1 Tax=Nakamurella sp. TaxID=1869182 RepID=UPI003B3AB1D3
MTLSPARRRRIDRLVAGGIALVVLAVAAVVYLTSDVRATDATTVPRGTVPAEPTAVPSTLSEKWSVATDPAVGAVASPYGVVVTGQGTAAIAYDARTGERRWSYDRGDEPLCAIGSGDTDAPGVTARGKVRGVMVVSNKNGYCSQVMLLDPATGERHYYRTSPNQPGGALAFGGPYAGWLGPTLVELWRDDLVRTIQYGDEPAPPKPNATHTGCTFTDMIIDDQQFATVEHCAGSPNAQVVLNWTTPDSAPDKPDDQDVFKHTPRATIDTGSTAARLVGITSDRVAVLVSDPEPAVVRYDTAGREVGRTPVDVPATSIVDADRLGDGDRTRPTPAVRDGSTRFSVVGDTLLAVMQESATVQTTPTSTATRPTTEPPTPGVLASDTATTPVTERVEDLTVGWTRAGVLGLPAVIGDQVLLPVSGGLAPVAAGNGNPGIVPTLIPVDRGGATGRVDVAAVGPTIVEIRGDRVVGLS